MVHASLLALTDEIYDAAAGDTPWAVVGRGLAKLVNAQSASLMVSDPATGSADLLCHPNIPPEAVADYAAHYRGVDLWTTRAAQRLREPDAALRVWSSGQLVPDREFLKSEFWDGFGRRYGLRYVVGTVVPLGAAGAMPIGLHRPPGAAPFDALEREMVSAVLPHLRRAMQLRHRLGAGKGPPSPPGLAALDGLATGIVVVDAALRVLLANGAAEELAATGQGFRMIRDGHGSAGAVVLAARHRRDSAALAALVGQVALAGSAGGAVRLHDEDGTPAIAALVTPLPARLSASPFRIGGRVPGQAMVMLRSLAGIEPPRAALLRELFGLTAAEAEVARALAGGATKADVASQRGLQESTVRSQVRSVLAKTGAANLRDLERMLAALSGL